MSSGRYQSSAVADVEARGRSSRAPTPSAPCTCADVRDRLGEILSAHLGRALRFELFVAVAEGELVPSRAGGSDVRARQLLAAVRARIAASRGALEDAHALAADALPGRCPVMTLAVRGRRGELLGVVLAEGRAEDGDFDLRALAALRRTGPLAAETLQRLADHRSEVARVRRELDRRFARDLQRGFLRSALPEGTGVTVLAEYLPAFEVGGDFYGVRQLPDGSVSVVIGDASGNGMSAALVMSRVSSDLDRAIAAGASPGRALAEANERFVGAAPESFVTAACARIDPSRRRLTTASAGHLPLAVRRPSGEVFTFGGATGLPLGVAACDYAEDELFLGAGDILLLVTDGLLEALDHPSGHMGLELLLDQVRQSPHDPAALHARIRAEVDRARIEHPLDDVTWVGLQVSR